MAVGDRTEKRLYGPYPLSSNSASPNVVSVTPSRLWAMKQVIFTNTSGAEALVYMSIGPIATAGYRVISGLPIAAGDVVVWDTALVASAGEDLNFYADRSGVNVTVVGWEKVTA